MLDDYTMSRKTGTQDAVQRKKTSFMHFISKQTHYLHNKSITHSLVIFSTSTFY